MVIPARGRVERPADRYQNLHNNADTPYNDVIRAWLIRQPPATLSVLAFKLALTLLVHFDAVDERSILLIPRYPGYLKFWRFLTAALYSGRLSLASILAFASTFQSCSTLERTVFFNKEDMAYLVLLISVVAGISCISLYMSYSGGALDMALITLACRFNSGSVMDIIGFRVNARSAPLTIIALNMILSSRFPTDYFIGYLIATAYVKIYYSPALSRFLRTPKFLVPMLKNLTSLII